MRLAFALVLIVALVAGAAFGQGYSIGWSCISSGGGIVSGGGYRLNCTVGQPAAGFVQSASLLHWIGFWGGDTPTPIVVPDVASARLLPDGTFISIAGKIATSAVGDFAGFFYVEEPGRHGGLRVAVSPAAIPDLARGSIVNVMGTLDTTPAGERQLIGPIAIVTASRAPLTPVGMPNRSLGGRDLGNPAAGLGQYGVLGGIGLNNVGLLIRTWGTVIEEGSGYVVIDDGSLTPVRLDTTMLALPPTMGQHISVIGISSLYKPASDRLRLVLPRHDTDVLTE